ncbi:MAG: archaellin/type IV pilin N-terminal domain-containing protein [Candidatus Woesearchaeota archaeon]
MNKKAEMGIGTLIIFIAMILVAAIAASVLIQTATSLQNRALLTGTRTQEQVGTALQVLQVHAENGSSGGTVDDFFVKFKLSPGSEAMRLEDTLVEFDTSDESAFLRYNESVDCSARNYTTGGDGEGNFGARYMIEGNSWTDGYIHAGDVLEICFESPRSIGSEEDVSIRLVPQVGMASVTETAVPEIIGQTRIYVFP